jgi:predicted lactoylglutathione lyase
MSRLTFVNLPVKGLSRTTAFFSALGFEFGPTFTDQNATRVIISEETSALLVTEPFFRGSSLPGTIADTTTSREVIVGLWAASREEVDDLVADR